MLRIKSVGRVFKRFTGSACETKPKPKQELYHHPIDYIIDPSRIPNDKTHWHRFMCLYVLSPLVAIWSVYVLWDFKHEKVHRMPFRPYSWRQLQRPFPWGDGKHSLLFNPLINANVDGYEVDLPEEDE